MPERSNAAVWLSVFLSLLFYRAGFCESVPFRFAFSSRMFAGFNENDAKASVKAWARMLAKECEIRVDPEPAILKGPREFAELLEKSLVDVGVVTTDEFLVLEQAFNITELFVSKTRGSMTEEYLLLVHSKNGIRDIGELQGRSVNFYDNSRASLAPMWVRTLLLERGFKPPEQFFRKVNVYRKISHVILPVFFGQVEGCLVTRAGFETMGELNPQIRENLRVLAASPPFVPSVGFYRPGYEPYFLDKLTNELVRMNQTISGRQVLNVFQSDSLGKAPSSVLDSARELYSIHEKSIRKNGAVK